MKTCYVPLLAILVGCSGSDGAGPRLISDPYRFPLIKECEQEMNGYLQKLEERFDITVSVSKFDQSIPSHPDIIGYVEISGKNQTSFSLESMANTIVLSCYPVASFKFQISDSRSDEIWRTLQRNRTNGYKNYILEVDGGVEVFVKNQAVYFEN